MYRKIVLVLIIYLFFSCDKNPQAPVNILFSEIDSTTIMYFRVNDEEFYGKYYYVNQTNSNDINEEQYTVVKAQWVYANIEIQLDNSMQYSQRGQNHYSRIWKDNRYYRLEPDCPYDLNLTSLQDSLISGKFFGTFVNSSSNDTLRIRDGFFISRPHAYDSFFLSMYSNDAEYVTGEGRELFRRNEHTIITVDSSYQDSLTAYASIMLRTLSHNFIKEFHFWPKFNTLYFKLSILSSSVPSRSEWIGYSGHFDVSSIDTIKENGEFFQRIGTAKFEIEANNENFERINIHDGNFSIHGY